MKVTKKFLCQYYHDGTWWVLDLHAYDMEDAQARADRLGLQLMGEHKGTAPGWLPMWAANLFISVANFFSKK